VAVAHSFFCGSGEHFACGLEEIELIIQPGAHEDSLAGIDFRDGQKLAARVGINAQKLRYNLRP
jgi:hypothetical protein